MAAPAHRISPDHAAALAQTTIKIRLTIAFPLMVPIDALFIFILPLSMNPGRYREPFSSRAHPPIDDQHADGHEAALLGSEEQYRARNLLGSGMPSQWNQSIKKLAGVLSQDGGQLLLDFGLKTVLCRPGVDGVDANSPSRSFFGDAAHQA